VALVKVGVIALRSPSGDFLPEEPIYRDIPEEKPESEYIPLDELGELFADKFKAYKKAQKDGGSDLRKSQKHT